VAPLNRPPAVLLLGPTGAGKTPLGQMLEARGMGGRNCVHFDFGANLREVVARNEPDALISRPEIEFLRRVLASGALLEDGAFPLAERILRSFLARRIVDRQTWVVLNGLPRHVGQAEAMDGVVQMRAVVCLTCSRETVFQRLKSNVGGDRGERRDDDFPAVCRKLELYDRRTAPLLEHYQRRGLPVARVEVAAATTTAATWGSFAFFSRDW
jgi:adenylate kinase